MQSVGGSVVQWLGRWTCDSMVASSIPGRRGYSTGMDHRLPTGIPPRYFTKPLRPTQPPTLSGTGNLIKSNQMYSH